MTHNFSFVVYKIFLKIIVLLKGVCNNSPIDWNYYLTRQEGEIYFEGYKNEQWKKVGNKWITSNYQVSNDAYLEMSPADNSKMYPVGFFVGNIYDPNK